MLLLSVLVTFKTCLYFCQADYLYDMDLTNPSPTVMAKALTNTAETNQTWPPIINEYTACYWMKAGVGPHYVFAVINGTQIKLGMSVNTTLVELFVVNVIKTFVNPPFQPDVWNHVCQTWTNVNGSGFIYFNGQVAFNFTGVAIGQVIPMNQSYIVLGNAFAYGPTYPGSFQGRISEFHFWSKVLSADEVDAVSSCADDMHGNVLDWHNIGWTTINGAVIRPTALTCLVQRELEEDVAVDFMENELEDEYEQELYDYYYNYDDEYDYNSLEDYYNYYAEKEAALEEAALEEEARDYDAALEAEIEDDTLASIEEDVVAKILDYLSGREEGHAAVETYRNPMSGSAGGINNVLNVVYPPKY